MPPPLPNQGSQLPPPRTQPQSQPPPTQQLHPEIRSVVQLNHAHAHKVYFSGPLTRKIEANPDGSKPAKDDGFIEIWAQLGGTTLSVWDMKEIQAANKQGKEVPPSYLNVTDSVRVSLSFFSLFAKFLLYFSSAYPDFGISHIRCHSYNSRYQILKYIDLEHGWGQPLRLFMPIRPGSYVLGRCSAFGFLGKI